MTGLVALWLPIVLSSVIVFVVSSIIHTVLPWHKGDYPGVPREDDLIAALRPLAVPPGDYMVPHCNSMAEMKSPEFKEKLERGPVMVMTVRPNGVPSMGSSLTMWFIYSLVIAIFSGYIASHALPVGANYLEVFRFVGASAFMGYAFGLWQMSIWWGRGWGLTIKATIDGLVYALLTAGTFGWLWPR